ncbi:MAG: MFS transporter [Gammaproteobacteria bacterium]|nr:MFS transporter [Gammaproteobacteria bacterium]
MVLGMAAGFNKSEAQPHALSDAYKAYFLGVLTLTYTFNFIDRTIFSILIPPIKAELELSDTQLGLVGGIAFALFYSTLGLPIAKWADRGNRVNIITLCLSVWSAMTAAGALVMNFWHLLAVRIGVAIGEAGGTPPAHSIIGDLYEPRRRTTAVSIYQIGAPLGGALGLIVGGWAAENFGWRNALLIVGLPGLLLALLLRATLREPPRGLSEVKATDGKASTIPGVARLLWARRTYRYMITGTAFTSIASYAHIQWTPAFLVRSHELGLSTIGFLLGAFSLVGGVLGVAAGGYLSDRLAERDPKWWMLTPGFGILIGLPFAVAALLLTDITWVLVCLFIPSLTTAIYPGPTFATAQKLVGVKMRAMAVAFSLFVITMVGLGIGPLLVGGISDLLSATYGEDSLRVSLLWIQVLKLISGCFYILAASSIAADLKRAPD